MQSRTPLLKLWGILCNRRFEKTVEKRILLENTPTFKRKLNEDQLKHSKEVERIIWTTFPTHLNGNEKEKAKEAVEEGAAKT